MSLRTQRRVSDALLGAVFAMVFAAWTQPTDQTFRLVGVAIALGNALWGMGITRRERKRRTDAL